MRVSLVRGVLLVPAFLAALGLAAGAVPAQVQAEPSQTGATAAAATIAEVPVKSPAAAPGDGQLKPDAATIDTAPKPSAASSSAAGSAASVAGTAAEPAPPAAPPPAPTLLVGIDLGSQRLTVTEHGRVKYTWPISSGREGYRTPTGSFRPSWMAQMWYSKQYDDAPMPHAVFFNGGIAVHATQSTGMLGRPASHGCIRLSPSNAATFYKLVSTHGKAMTRIKVHGTAKDSTPMASRQKRPADQYASGRGVRELPPYYASGRYSGRQRYSYSGYGGGYSSGYGGPAPRYIYPGDALPYGYRPARPVYRGPVYRGYGGPRGYYD